MQINNYGKLQIQKRFSFGSGFARKWAEFKNGFDDEGSYWLGLERLHRLTSHNKNADLEIAIVFTTGPMAYVAYKTFQVAGESDGYRLYIDDYDPDRSNIENAFLTPDAGVFVTQDRDHGEGLSSLAWKQGGSWWAKGFDVINLNAAVPANYSKLDWAWMGVKRTPAATFMDLVY